MHNTLCYEENSASGTEGWYCPVCQIACKTSDVRPGKKKIFLWDILTFHTSTHAKNLLLNLHVLFPVKIWKLPATTFAVKAPAFFRFYCGWSNWWKVDALTPLVMFVLFLPYCLPWLRCYSIFIAKNRRGMRALRFAQISYMWFRYYSSNPKSRQSSSIYKSCSFIEDNQISEKNTWF